MKTSTNDARLMASSPRDILRRQRIEVRFKDLKPEPEDLVPVAEAVAVGDGLVAPDDDVSDAVVEETCRRYAWRLHRRCRGRGFSRVEGRPVPCACAARRMKRRIDEGDGA